MRVNPEPVDGTQIQRLTVTQPQGNDVHAGQCVGYRCAECKQADETLAQIWHDEDCSLAGEHGRGHYDEFEPTFEAGGPTPEFEPDHEIQVVHVYDRRVIAYRCTCGNLDECCLEVVHDTQCGLADPDCPQGQTDEAELAEQAAMTGGGQ